MAVRERHHKINHAKINPGQDHDEFLYVMDNCRDRLNKRRPPERPADQQYEDILVKALSPKYEGIWRAHFKRQDFGIADIRRMMVVIYDDNVYHRSVSPAGTTGPSATLPT